MSLDQMFEQCTAIMRMRKNQRIDADYLSEEVSDQFGIFDEYPSIVLPDWIGASAEQWLAKQEWFIPDVDGGFWTETDENFLENLLSEK